MAKTLIRLVGEAHVVADESRFAHSIVENDDLKRDGPALVLFLLGQFRPGADDVAADDMDHEVANEEVVGPFVIGAIHRVVETQPKE